MQAAPAAVLAPTVAVDPLLIGEVRLVMATEIDVPPVAVVELGVVTGLEVATGAGGGAEPPRT